MPHLSLEVWAIGSLAILCLAFIEAGYRESVRLGGELESLKASSEAEARKKARSEFVAQFYARGVALQRHAPKKDAPDDDVVVWQNELHEWTNETHAYLSGINTAVTTRFLDTTGALGGFWTGVRMDVQGHVTVLASRIKTLREILENPGVHLN